MPLQTKRAYDEPEKDDGYRVLIDRLWPRGINKEELQLDDWLKELAPSEELRKWFNHDPEKFKEFKKKYRKELNDKSGLVASLLSKTKGQNVTLIYAAKEREHNNAVVLKEYLADKLG